MQWLVAKKNTFKLEFYLNKVFPEFPLVFCLLKQREFTAPFKIVERHSPMQMPVSEALDLMGLDARKPVFRGLGTTKVLTSLRIGAVWSAPLLFANHNVAYLSVLLVKFKFST